MAKDIGFNDTTIINSDDKATLLAMFDKLTRISEDRRLLPHNQMNNVTYEHRAMLSAYTLQLGDTCFMLPPEFICVTSESTSQQIVTLRQENSMRQKAGSHKRTLLIDLVFNGANQINGYRVEGPESGDGKDYYVDGLRQLLAQFKCTPFLPIQNEFINGVHGIFTVVLQGITISTIPSFPTLMKAQLTLQEVEMFPYIEMPNAAFKSLIDWDLFRFYYQRFLTEKYEYKKLQSLPVNKDYNRFKISILKDTVFSDISDTEEKYGNKNDALLREICNNDNYDVWVDSAQDNVKINEFQCGYYNILTNIQLNDCSCPTVQFMGGMDTIFNIAIETTDINVVRSIEQCRMFNDTMARNNAKYRSLGFVKLDSELVAFTGSLFVVVENVVTTTTPDFPGLYQVQIQCVSFDIGQSARENLNGFLPFDDNVAKTYYGKSYSGSCAKMTDSGYVSDHTHEEQCIEQSMEGLYVKIRQDAYAEWKLRSTVEVYPDLYLPTYAEVDSFINKCNVFRTSKGLENLPYSKYPTRPECMLQGLPLGNSVSLSGDVVLASEIGSNSEYSGFVDPDFYVFYPSSYQSFDLDVYDLYDPVARKSITKDITRNTRPFGNDSTSETSGIIGSGNSSMIDDFVDLAVKQVGKPYIWGDEGPNSFDCSGLVSYCLIQVGAVTGTPRYTTSSIVTSKSFVKVPWNEIQRGDCLIKYSSTSKKTTEHVVIYMGDNQVVHAANKKDGVKISNFSGYCSSSLWDAYRPVAFAQPSASSRSVASGDSSTEEGRQKIIWDTFKALGYSDEAVAGMIGCWTSESSCNPATLEGSYLSGFKAKYTVDGVINSRSQMNAYTTGVLFPAYDKSGLSIRKNAYKGTDGNYYPGIGLVQWTGPRGQAFLNYAGSNWTDLATQVQYVSMELSSSYQKAYNALTSATSPEEAAEQFCRLYEGYTKSSGIATRKQTARTVYNKFKGSAPSTSEGDSSAPKQNLSDRSVLTRAEFESICKTIYGQVEGMKNYQDEVLGLAQMVYDLITHNATTAGLGSILNNSDFFPEKASNKIPADVESTVESVFCNGKRKWPNSTIKAYLSPNGKLANFNTFDKMYDRVSDLGQLCFWESVPHKASSTKKFTIVDSDEAGANSAANYEYTTSVSYQVKQASLDKFAEPVFVKTDAITYNDGFSVWFTKGGNSTRKDLAKDVLNDGENIFGSSFVDEAQYSCRGRLVRAFPTYLFCILDDDTQWYDGRKLWTNYYMRKSVVDIQVHETNDMPIATAVLTVANVYGSLSTKQKGLKNYDIRNDLSDIGKWWYDWTGQVVDLGSPNLTESTIKLKQVIYNNAKLREGSRAHIRMGYGSDPLSLAPVMNGTISEVSLGDQLSIIVTSDGVEFTQHITSSTDKTNNGWLGLFGLGEDQESSNLIAGIMCKRSSIVNYFNSAWFEGSKYSIEHFGLYFNQDAMGAVYGILTGVIAGAAIGAATGAVAGPLGAVLGAGIGLLGGIFFSSDLNIKDLWDGYAEQYDICKNIYKANYKREHYIYASFGEVDGEENICFNQNNMTPWDVFQIATQQCPEYIVKPTYHQFDSRLYFGVPLWMEKYRYDFLGGQVYEECKASTQVHMLESLTNIIDNQVKVTNKYNDTNKKVIYVLGSSPASTKVIHSDDTIDYAKQKTGIIDSAVTQDCLGPDALYEFFGYQIGQDSARRIGISNLLYGWQQQYQGEIICMGLPGVKAHDYILVNDSYVNMTGVAIAREVVHSFSTDTGFTTSVTPGMIGFSTDQESGLIVAMQNYLQILNGFSSFLLARNMMKVNYEKNLDTLAAMSVLEQREKYILINQTIDATAHVVQGGLHVVNSAVAIYGIASVGLEVFNFTKACIETRKIAKLGKIAASAVSNFKKAWNGYKAAKDVGMIAQGVGQISRLFTSISAGVAGGLTAVFPPAAIVWLIVSFAIDIILNEVFEWLENRNVCVLLPLWWEGYPFVSGINGGKKILLCGNNSTVDGRESDTQKNQNAHNDDDKWDDWED